MISSGLLAENGVRELTAPVVYLAPDRHAYLVLGDGDEPLITWSMSYQFASEQADIHAGVVVAVPIVRDSSWRRSTADDVPALDRDRLPRKDYIALVEPQMRAEPLPPPDDEPVPAGYPVGRARVRGQGHPDGWSSARPDVEGQRQAPAIPLIRRSQPFGDPEAPPLPEDPEGALRDALGGGEGPEVDEAMSAFHAASQADVATLQKIRDGLKHG